MYSKVCTLLLDARDVFRRFRHSGTLWLRPLLDCGFVSSIDLPIQLNGYEQRYEPESWGFWGFGG